jgi:hypothetical protein
LTIEAGQIVFRQLIAFIQAEDGLRHLLLGKPDAAVGYFDNTLAATFSLQKGDCDPPS